jgi:NADPH:quinone reductase
MKAIVFDRFGDPAEVLQVREVPRPEPGRGEVRVRMRASPINPSDLLVVRGQYGRLPELPATPGFEGVGVVDATGPGLLRHVRGLKPGRRVVVLSTRGGSWQEYVNIPARNAVPLSDDLTDEQAATFFVNPASALVMTRYILNVPRGAWLLQTAASSTLARMVIRLARQNGFRTLNVVRRPEVAEDLRLAGADAVVSTASEQLEDRVRELTNGDGVPFALDAVGGTVGSAVVRVLATGGRMLVYGTLSGEPLTVDPRILMTGGRSIEGFWLSNWVARQGGFTMLGLFRQIGGLMKQGILTSKIIATFPLDAIQEAVRATAQPGQHGKVLLRMGS